MGRRVYNRRAENWNKKYQNLLKITAKKLFICMTAILIISKGKFKATHGIELEIITSKQMLSLN